MEMEGHSLRFFELEVEKEWYVLIQESHFKFGEKELE